MHFLKDPEVQAIKQLIVGLLSYIAIFTCSIFLSQKMGAHVFGDYNVAIAGMEIITSLVLLGTDIAANLFAAEMYYHHETVKLFHYFIWNIRLLKTNIKISFVIFTVFLLIATLLHITHHRAIDNYYLAIYCFFLVPLTAITILLSNYIISFHHVLLGSVYGSLAIHLFILSYFLIALYGFGLSITNNIIIFLILALSFLSLLAIELFPIRKHLRYLLHAINKHTYSHYLNIEHIWRVTSIELVSTQIIYTLLRYLDLFIIKIFSPSANAAGMYAAIMVITQIIYFIPVSVITLAKPSISELYDQPSEYQKLQDIINAVNSIILIALPILLFIVIYWRIEILNLFGAGFSSASNTLIIFSVGVAFAGLSRAAKSLLTFSGHQLVILYSAIAYFILLITVGIPATYYFSIYGIAIVVATLFFLQAIIYIFFAKYYLPMIKPLLFF